MIRVEKLLNNDALWLGDSANLARRIKLERELDDLLKKEEVAWRQRSRAT